MDRCTSNCTVARCTKMHFLYPIQPITLCVQGCNPVYPASLQPCASQVHEDLLCAALGVASSSEIIDGQDTPTPYLGLTAIILGATKRLPSLTDQERVGLEDELGDVASNLGQCERLLRQPIPLGYERSTIRFLWYGYRYRCYESKDTHTPNPVGTTCTHVYP